MRLNWHERAARVAAANPHWTWSQVCAAVAKRGPQRQTIKPTPVVRDYWWNK